MSFPIKQLPIGLPNAEQRHENRLFDEANHVRVSLIAKISDTDTQLDVLNYHYRGACFRVPGSIDGQIFFDHDEPPIIHVVIGKRRLPKSVKYRICWEDLAISRTLGIEFLDLPRGEIERSQRIFVNEKYRPTVTSDDPLEATRRILFTVENLSKSGMLIKTSLSNKHLLPGMHLKSTCIDFPGGESVKVILQIENARRIANSNEFGLGVSFLNPTDKVHSEIARYLTLCVPRAYDEPLGHESFTKAMPKRVKEGLTFRTVRSSEEYQQVLELRFEGYRKHDKVKVGSSPKDQGEGLENEGLILAGFLGGQMVVSAEFRFGDGNLPFRSTKIFGDTLLEKVDTPHTVEINKLVVHPGAQGSDIVLGLMQKVTAIVLARGGMDILIAATDELSKFYTKIGASFTGISVPHPTLAEKRLNAMLIDRRVFFGEGRFSVLGFEAIYQSIYCHLEGLGVVPAMRGNFTRHIRRFIEKTILSFKSKIKPKKRPTSQRDSIRLNDDSVKVDAIWTKQHILSMVMYPYILEADVMIGRDQVDGILRKLNMTRRYLKGQSGWVSVGFLDAFCDEFSKFGDLKSLSSRAGTRGLRADVARVNHYLLKSIATPEYCFRTFSKTAARFNKTRTYRVSELTLTAANVHIGYHLREHLPKHPESCLNWSSNLLYTLELLTGRQGKVVKTACCYEGAQECTYRLQWDGSLARIKRIGMSSVAGLAITTLSSVLLASIGITKGMVVLLIAAFLVSQVYFWMRHIWQKSYHAEVVKEFERYQSEADQRYAELEAAKDSLSERFREAQLLAESAKMVQKYDNVNELLNSALAEIRRSFGYSRSYVMLANEDGTHLTTKAVSGVDEHHSGMVWQFHVDITKLRDKKVFISSAYNNGQTVLIDNVEDHFFQFNEPSQKIITSLGITSFAVVPIPREIATDSSDVRGWGVLIAERDIADKAMSHGDAFVLSRLADHLGLALDKQAKLDREETMRQVFQKYVPTTIADQSLRSRQMPKLGGTQRRITCMFVDLRGFTRFSATLSPDAAVDYLNTYFTVICHVVAAHGGSVDKFIGDGVLITWGAITDQTQAEANAHEAIAKIFDAVEKLNLDLHAMQLPPVRIGIGVNSGEALVGNVGCDDRMEFTCIGNTVNVAARLQDLCKRYNTSAIISEETYRALGRGSIDRKSIDLLWQEVKDASIEGLDSLHNIYIHRKSVRILENQNEGRSKDSRRT